MNNTRPLGTGESSARSAPQTKPGADSPSHFASQLQEIITTLVLIFGPDITYARLSHLAEISLDSSGKVHTVTGSPTEIIKELQLLFSLLSPEVASTHITLTHQAPVSATVHTNPEVDGMPEKIYI